ncbi:sugar MFS transporter [Pseudoalteromonas sp. T1lg75]|uniref:sugar MFS transporter n=1 Tax=Pseudoalteromonas sp. T1lg75 TaxID=2077102 RepID=UPI000CF6877D|nr:sugar MFS transporter [Pseudoalteromonas sp. T1lg75]
MQNSIAEHVQPTSGGQLVSMLIIGGLFFLFGFVTWLNGSLIPFLQMVCDLNHIEAYMVTLVFYIAYTVMALPSAHVLKKFSYKHGMSFGLAVMAIGAILFIPAAQLQAYWLFLIALFTLGSGLTLLQTAANPYIVLLGSKETAAVRISLMGILNKSAGVVAPLLFSALVFSDIANFSAEALSALNEPQKQLQLQELASRLIAPYLVMSISLAVLAALIMLAPLPGINEPEQAVEEKGKSILQFPRLILGVVALFFYIGAEVIAGDTIGLYGKEQGVMQFAELTSYTMGFMVLGYILGILLIPRFFSQQQALVFSAISGCIFSLLIIWVDPSHTSLANTLLFWLPDNSFPDTVLFVALLGLSNALVWPTIWPMALAGLGDKTQTGAALLIMGISGGAILPLVYGVFAEYMGDAQQAYYLLVPCYGFILYYALAGHKLTSWRK